MAGRNDTNKRKLKDAAIVGGTMLGGTAAATYLGTADERRSAATKKKIRKKREEKSKARKTKTANMKTQLAQQNIQNLQSIKEKDLSARDKKIRRELINREKATIKGLKPPTLVKTAARLGLKSVPGVGTFLAMISSTPAGQGSALYGPGSKKNK